MGNFLKLDGLIDPQPLLDAIRNNSRLWDQVTLRQDYEGSAHQDARSIIIKAPTTAEGLFDNLDSVAWNAADILSPAFLDTIDPITRMIGIRELGRVMIVSLKAGGQITPHVDEGRYARYFARFHTVLQSSAECLFTCGGETVHMAPGETWWFNHQLEHSVVNDGPERLHLIIDGTAPGFTGALS